MIEYRHFAPKKYKCLYCSHSPLEIWAFVYDVESKRTGKKYERSTPVLVCSGFDSCGTFFDPMEFGLNEFHKDLRADKK